MIGAALLLPAVFLSIATSLVAAMFAAMGAFLTLFMGAYAGGLTLYSTAFLAFLLLLFS